jgi:type IV pilus assembly protein PilX
MKRPYIQFAPQRGAALVVALILLMVLTILGVTGMSISSTELVMAGSEQDRERAFQAAEIGIERATRALGTVPATPGATVTVAAADVTGSPVNAASGAATDTFTTTSAYNGSSDIISDFNGTKFMGFHYTVRSTGNSSRGSASLNTQGAYVINAVFGQKTYGP